MSNDISFSLTTKHREDAEKIKVHASKLVKERLSADKLYGINRDGHFGIGIDEVTDGNDSAVIAFCIMEDTAAFFPDIQMRLEITWNGPVDKVYMSKNGELVEIYPWVVFVHAPDSVTYTKLLDIINAKHLPEMKQYQKEYSVCWEFDKETEKEQTKNLLEEISRQIGDIKLLAAFYDYCDMDAFEKTLCVWLCNGKWRNFNYEYCNKLFGWTKVEENVFDKILSDAEIKDYEKNDDILDL